MHLLNFLTKRSISIPPSTDSGGAELKMMVTLWPTFPHFKKFAQDNRLSGIRLNSAMIGAAELDTDLPLIQGVSVPLYFDVKGRQLRITDVSPNKDHLELKLNHPISVKTPTEVLFKAGEDIAILNEVKDGNHLIFQGGPKYMVHPGESLSIRHKSLSVGGPIFTDAEKEKAAKVVKAGFNRYFISFVEEQRDIDEFRELVGKDAELILKIENLRGMKFASTYKPKDGVHLCAARGDLFVEIDRPHQIINAVRTIIEKDPTAFVGSRLLLSLVNQSVPSCADLSDLAWLYDIGYRNMMLCDELCLKDELLTRATNVFYAFKRDVHVSSNSSI